MISGLRLRFFLVVWPLVVAVTVGVGWFFGRWTRVEVRRTMEVGAEVGMPEWATEDLLAELASVGDGPPAEVRLRETAEGLAGDGERPLIMLARDDGLLASEPLPDGWRTQVGDGRLMLRATTVVDGAEQEIAQLFMGVELPGGGQAFVVPSVSEMLADDVAPGIERDTGPGIQSEAFVRAADRAIAWAVILGSIFAAVATFLLAQPVVGQADRLAAAARRIRAGDLGARVQDESRNELGDVARAFNEMAEELERSEVHRRRLIGDVAHELRTPLTNLVGGFEALEDGLLEPDEATLGSLKEEVTVLRQLVQDLQEVAVAEAGGLSLDLGPVDMVDAAHRAVASFTGHRSGPEIRVVTEDAATAWADPRRVDQILRNLLRNAIAHSPPDEPIRVEVTPAVDEVVVSVVDRGPGVPPEHQALVWNRFHRVDSARARSSGGVGLGLAIVKGLVEAQGGSVRLSSPPAQGATFSFSLPTAHAGTDHRREPAP